MESLNLILPYLHMNKKSCLIPLGKAGSLGANVVCLLRPLMDDKCCNYQDIEKKDQ